MDEEIWDYKIDAKQQGLLTALLIFVIFTLFTALCIDQLIPAPNKSIPLGIAFGVIAATTFVLLCQLMLRFFCFRVYIGRNGFYFQSSPVNGKYYKYAGIRACGEELKTGRPIHMETRSNYFFHFKAADGRVTEFIFDKALYSHEIDELKARIRNAHIHKA